MNEQSNKTSPEASVEESVETLHLRYGDLAPEYAKVRSQTAKDAGEEGDALYWGKVEKSLQAQEPEPPVTNPS